LKEPKIGTTMPDGTVYAGVSQKSGNQMYIDVRGAGKGTPLTLQEMKQAQQNLSDHGHFYRLPTFEEAFTAARADASERFNDASAPTEKYWTPTQNEYVGTTAAATVRIPKPPKP
jgi:hypothetical protein